MVWLPADFCSASIPGPFTDYILNPGPMDKRPGLSREYRQLNRLLMQGPLTQGQHERRVAILEEVLKDEPNWVDGHWLLASELFGHAGG